MIAIGSQEAWPSAQCAEKLSRAMGLEHVKDQKGTECRKYYAARIREKGQLVMKWDDLNAERPFMEIAAANRRIRFSDSAGNLRMTLTAITTDVAPMSLSRLTSIST